MKKIYFLVPSVLLLTLSFLMPSLITTQFFSEDIYKKRTESIIKNKREKVHVYISHYLKSDIDKLPAIIHDAKREGIIFLHYKDDSLHFWSSNKIPVSNWYDSANYKSHLIKLFNSYYLLEKIEEGNNVFIGLITLYNQYPHENKFLHSGFHQSFGIPDHAVPVTDPDVKTGIYDESGNYLFSLVFKNKTSGNKSTRIFSALFFLIGLLLLFQYIYLSINSIRSRKKSRYFIFSFIAGIIFLRLVQLMNFNIFKNFELFDPFVFADSSLVPSLGDLLLNSLFIFFFSLLLYRFINFSGLGSKHHSPVRIIRLVAYLSVFLAIFIYAHYFSRSLIYNSSIVFQPNRISGISIYPIISIFICGLNYFSSVLVLSKILKGIRGQVGFYVFIPTYILFSGLVFSLLNLLPGYKTEIYSLIFFVLVSVLVFLRIYYGKMLSKYSAQVLFVLLLSLYILAFISTEGVKKDFEIKSSLVLNLANQHDPVAEYLFEDISEGIEKDTSIVKRLDTDSIQMDRLFRYLERKYFTGYWNKYHLQVTLCRPTDKVLIEQPEEKWLHCYSFFDDIISEKGFKIPNSKFYFLENFSGKISYLGEFSYTLKNSPYELTMYIELDSRLFSNLLGYPELLLEEALYDTKLLERFSYAKYYRGELITKSGDFDYSLSPEIFGSVDEEFTRKTLDNYSHLIYKPENDSLIVLSFPKIRFFDILVSFSYIFLFYYMCVLLVITAQNLGKTDFVLLSNLRSKIQFSVLGILIVSMILIAASSVWLNIRSYRNNQKNILHEKIQSVLIELSHKLAFEDKLTSGWSTRGYDNLNILLIKFSDVFYSDINLYSPDGELLATSRYEIFDLGLQGPRINPVAYHKLHNEKRSQFTLRETIGELTFQSAYAPFENNNGRLLAYVNLPYFTKQKEFQESLSALIVTIINIYVILILITIIASVFIADQITRPLEILQQRFRQLKVGKKYVKIEYKRNDEIGRLVQEYNRMLSELEKSVNMLAQNERELAWREMAKQIAHEIKNPLTPMRLSVQHLQKIWKEKHEDFEKYFETVSATLVEQIDNLSAIASAFSNFATMPEIKPQPIDIVDTVRHCVDLFKGSSSYDILFITQVERMIVSSDRDQLTRVLINIIKNGIQAIPEDRKGLIEVSLTKETDEVIIRITDNGTGIPDEIQAKIFMPNFTTKSSGMGLGLAIARNITEQMKGKISFETQINKGSVFTLRFPINN